MGLATIHNHLIALTNPLLFVFLQQLVALIMSERETHVGNLAVIAVNPSSDANRWAGACFVGTPCVCLEECRVPTLKKSFCVFR